MKNILSIFITALISISAFSQPKLSSYPAAPAVIYLDFDGEYVNSALWNGGNPIDCTPASLSAEQITEVFNRVAEDFRPFEINITTDYASFTSAPLDKRIKIIVTGTSGWVTGVGGVSYIGSFTWGDDTPGFVFCDRLANSPKMVAECCSHESGHALGLAHQSRYDNTCNLTATYNAGAGSGEVGWAPVMGNSYYRNMSGWNNGPTPYGCAYMQDNLTIITTKNGFTYRSDDFNDDINGALTKLNPFSINTEGIISTNTDKDAFSFELKQSSNFKLDAIPFSVGAGNEGANLDIKLSLYNAAAQLIRVFNTAGSMSVSVDTILPAGNYYMLVDGTGNSNVSDYGSLGSYKLKGLGTPLPIRSIVLAGKTSSNQHQLNWNIITDDVISSASIETSADGIHFTALTTVNTESKDFSYTPSGNIKDIYYRIKVTSVLQQVMYSNTVLLKKSNPGNFKVINLTQGITSIQASVPYHYRLMDMNGTVLAKGTAAAGFNRLNLSARPAGMYLLQLVSNKEIQTERIIKQ